MASMNWIGSGEMVALGWTLLHFCWQGTALALLYALVRRLTAGASTGTRYALGMVTVALMPLAAIATFAEQQHLLLRIPRDGQEIVASQLGSLHNTILATVPITAPVVARTEFWIAWNADRLLPWVVSLWFIGVLLLAVRALGGWWRLEQIRASATRIIPAQVEASFRRTALRLGVSGKVVLRLSDEVISPLAMGVWRTAIILPVSAVLQLSPLQLEAVLAHEMAHVRRLDYLANLVQTAVECLLFFHPAVWWVSRHTRDLRELCCDEVAVRNCADPTVYVEALLHMEEQRSVKLHLAMALHGREGSLLKRVKQVLGEEIIMERETMCGVRIGVFGAVVLALILGPTVAKGLGSIHQATPTAATRSSMENLAMAGHVPLTVTVDDLRNAPAPEPVALATPAPSVSPRPAPQADPSDLAPEQTSQQVPEQTETKPGAGTDYINKMRAAGYPLDLNKDLDSLIALRSVGVTPEYARSLAQSGLGTPSLHDLIALKSQGVTPEYVAGLKSSGLPPESFHEVIAFKSVGVTPEYAKQIASIGLGNPSAHDLLALKAQGVTPEYVAGLKSSGLPPESLRDVIAFKSVGVTPEYAKQIASIGLGNPSAHDLLALKAQGITPEYVAEIKASGIPVQDLHELISIKALGVTPEYAKAMASVGFTGLTARDLVSLRAQNVTPEYVRWLKQTYPDVDMHGVRQAAVFHVDADFAAKAKAHGFNEVSLDKLVKLKMTGLLD